MARESSAAQLINGAMKMRILQNFFHKSKKNIEKRLKTGPKGLKSIGTVIALLRVSEFRAQAA